MPDIRVALMTGTGQGIGAGCAREMAKAGYKVSLMSPSERSVNLAAELGGIGRRGTVLEVGDLQAFVDATMTEYGRIDAVVSNMGHGGTVPRPSRLLDSTRILMDHCWSSRMISGTKAWTCMSSM